MTEKYLIIFMLIIVILYLVKTESFVSEVELFGPTNESNK